MDGDLAPDRTCWVFPNQKISELHRFDESGQILDLGSPDEYPGFGQGRGSVAEDGTVWTALGGGAPTNFFGLAAYDGTA